MLEEILLPSLEGIELDFQEKEVTLGTTVKEIVEYNPKRAYLLIMNISDTAAKISTKSDVTTSSGFPLAQTTGNVTFEFVKHANLSIQAWFGITSAASKKVSVLEGFLRMGAKKA